LNEDEIKALHQNDDEDEAELFVAESTKLAPQVLDDESNSSEDDEIVGTDSDESEEIIVEGEKEEPVKASAAATIALGGKLVRGQP
jgi:hypothetical protein